MESTKERVWFRGLMLVAGLLCLGRSGMTEAYLSPSEIVPHPSGDSAFIVLHTANRVVRFDVESATVTQEYPIGYPPTGVAVSADGKTLFVTDNEPEGSVWVFEVASGAQLSRLEAGHTTCAPVLVEDGRTLVVCNRFDNAVQFIDVESGKTLASVSVRREPIAAAATPDGKRLLAANHLPVGPANTGMIAAEVSLIDIASRSVLRSISLPNGSSSLRGLCLSPDGRYAYVTHIIGRYHLPTTQLDRGWMNTNAVSVIDVDNEKLLNTFLLDNIDQGAANPWGIACTMDGSYLVVSHSGSHEVSLIDREGLHRKISESSKPEQIPNDLAFMVGIRQRLRTGGLGPRGIAAIGNRVLAAGYFSDSVAMIDLDSPGKPRSCGVPLGEVTEMDKVRRGEFLFHDASVCFQQWQSCASCHPDARADALNWDLLNDGMGTPKNTKNMLLAHRTPPTSMTAIREDAEVSVRSGFRYIEFTVLPEEEAQAVDEYLKALEPIPSPYLKEGELSAAAQRGEAVYRKAACNRCHPAPLFTDLQRYDVGTGKGNDKGVLFDVPTLIESWRTAPYLYDGSAASMREVFEWHEGTENLSPEEIDDLVEYVLSL